MAARRHHAGPWLGKGSVLPHHFTSLGIERPNDAVSGIVGHVDIRHAAYVAVSGRVLWFALDVETFVLPYRKVEPTGQRTIGRRIPVGGALHARPDHVALHSGSGIGQAYGPPFSVDLL